MIWYHIIHIQTVCIHVCIYIYIHIYIYAYIHIYIYMSHMPKLRDRRPLAEPGEQTPNLSTKILPAKIRWLEMSVKFLMGMRTPPLDVKIMLESNPLKSRISARRLAVDADFARRAVVPPVRRSLWAGAPGPRPSRIICRFCWLSFLCWYLCLFCFWPRPREIIWPCASPHLLEHRFWKRIVQITNR